MYRGTCTLHPNGCSSSDTLESIANSKRNGVAADSSILWVAQVKTVLRFLLSLKLRIFATFGAEEVENYSYTVHLRIEMRSISEKFWVLLKLYQGKSKKIIKIFVAISSDNFTLTSHTSHWKMRFWLQRKKCSFCLMSCNISPHRCRSRRTPPASRCDANVRHRSESHYFNPWFIDLHTQEIFLFSKSSAWLWRPLSLLLNGYRRSFRCKVAKAWCWPLSTPSADMSHASSSRYAFIT